MARRSYFDFGRTNIRATYAQHERLLSYSVRPERSAAKSKGERSLLFASVCTAKNLVFWGLLSTTFASAQTYPTKPIRMIVPFSAGGPNDVAARIIGQQFTATWNQPVVIDNRTGAEIGRAHV